MHPFGAPALPRTIPGDDRKGVSTGVAKGVSTGVAKGVAKGLAQGPSQKTAPRPPPAPPLPTGAHPGGLLESAWEVPH